jgi:hypothetical protein
MKVDGWMAKVSQKIDRERAGARFCFTKWRNWRFRPQTVACAGEKCSKPCGTRSVCTMGVLKQKVTMEIPVDICFSEV